MPHRRGNIQFPSTNNQIMTQVPMTEMEKRLVECVWENWAFGYWNLFGDWNLVLGI
jgi:hypothetical protein